MYPGSTDNISGRQTLHITKNVRRKIFEMAPLLQVYQKFAINDDNNNNNDMVI
jgi:hypothetical protein